MSSPDGAKVTTAPCTTTYTTPASLNLERKYGYTLTFEKAGYSPATFDIRTNVRAGYVVADVLLTGLVGVLVDALTGGWSKLTPETASVTLNKVAMIEGPDRIYVAIKTDVAHGTVQVQSSVPGIVVQVVPAR